ncbi:hypothetical protein [Diaphorobacter caeni]|uniref:hypothetical protein n=1 Tax=Diaphorobacter caeni TaxID=2784387 RepID=UPI0018900986|nr:hypothetical protein [Diaphorobacter caeni]MBF5006975.1 hypothetical protein [Diaphorobacter caeni]
MDNRRIDITSEGDDFLAGAIGLAWGNSLLKATHYKVVNLAEQTRYYGEPTHRHCTENVEDSTGVPTMILLWSAERDAVPLPTPMGLGAMTDVVAGWLKDVPRGREPDHDGSNGHGWRVFTEAWGYVFGHHCAIVGIQPAWAMYGK